MKTFGFLSFGHYTLNPDRTGKTGAHDTLHQAIALAENADAIGVNGAYFRVHHYVPQGAAPIPLLAAIAARTHHLEVGTGVIDMRYENPHYLAEELAALDMIADGRIAIGISRGAPEVARRGWESFGYPTGEDDPKGAALARTKWLQLLSAVRGEAQTVAAGHDEQYPRMFPTDTPLPILPHSPGLDRRLWWGAGTHATAEQAARDGVNLMSSTLVLESDGASLGEIQAQQIQRYREEWRKTGHDWQPRVSVSRSIFPVLTDRDRQLFGYGDTRDHQGILDDVTATFGRTYVDEPDKLIEQLRADPAIEEADTLMLTIPNQAGVEINTEILQNFATHIAPALGWTKPPHAA